MTALAAALSHHQAGRLPEAEAIYRDILGREPNNVDALHLLGVLARQARRPAIAVSLIRQAIAIQDGVAEFHNNLGTALLDAGDMAEAQKAFMRALQIRPRYADAMLNLANVLIRMAKDEEAATCYRAVLALEPRHADAASNLGVALRRLGRVEEAVGSYRLAARLRPDHPDAHYNLGNALLASEHIDEAIEAYTTALAVRPDHAATHYNLGNALARAERLEEAEASFRRALEISPNYVEVRSNLGRALQGMGRLDEALECFESVLELAPEHADVHYNRALLLLLLGRHAEGWAEHEWRWRAEGFTAPRRHFAQPLWTGEAARGATLLLHAEQGLGDTIQFVRYVAAARRLVGRVVLEAPRALRPLLEGFRGVDELVATGLPLPEFDVHAPLLSLPHLLGEDAGVAVPYLAADEDKVASWRDRIRGDGPAVGIVWAGNPKHGNDRNRSLPAPLLWRLLEAPARFYSLQLAPRSAELDSAGLRDRIGDLSADLTDFAETAAAVSALDVVVTVDTSVAHLAGALGRPVWLMLPFAPDWRWSAAGESSRWYPRVRIFRQSERGDWDAVVEAIVRELTDNR